MASHEPAWDPGFLRGMQHVLEALLRGFRNAHEHLVRAYRRTRDVPDLEPIDGSVAVLDDRPHGTNRSGP